MNRTGPVFNRSCGAGLIKDRILQADSRHWIVEQTHRAAREALIRQVKGAKVVAGAVQKDGVDLSGQAAKYAIAL